MLYRIKQVIPLKDFRLAVTFDNGRSVVYDVKEDLQLPGYSALRDEPGLFDTVQLDESRTCIYWNEEIDLPSDILYEYGKPIQAA